MPEMIVVHLSAYARLVAEALSKAEQSTVVALTDEVGVSKTTVAKTLALLERADAAIRTGREDGGVREADLWSPGPALGALLFTADAEASGDGHVEASAGATEAVLEPHPSDAPMDGSVGEDSDGRTAAVLAQESDLAAAEYTAPPACVLVEAGAARGVEPDQTAAATSPADSVATSGVVMGASRLQVGSASVAGAKRLAPGELAVMVAAVLAAHPDIEYTPTLLSHMLEGRSPGAIHNALEKMIKTGSAVRTSDKPKRYHLAAPAASSGL